MDQPWGDNVSNGTCIIEKFEDNFIQHPQLPDSKQYLETLEKKLAKLKNQGSTAKDLLNALTKTKESHLERIVNSSATIASGDSDIDQPLASSTFQRFIAPDKQANTITELYELMKYDQLGLLFEELEKEKSE
ncbi:hypothetical protein RUM44_004263 [Polyplax serrata]|uniref:Uncharacterized protein n=1 Tax=Polyplax serrata TaxID=468196 RepID=A0ABR1B2B7_POLSC